MKKSLTKPVAQGDHNPTDTTNQMILFADYPIEANWPTNVFRKFFKMNRLPVFLCCVFLATNVEVFAQVLNEKNKGDVAENKRAPLFRQWGMFDETAFEVEIDQQISDSFGLLARSPDEFGYRNAN